MMNTYLLNSTGATKNFQAVTSNIRKKHFVNVTVMFTIIFSSNSFLQDPNKNAEIS